MGLESHRKRWFLKWVWSLGIRSSCVRRSMIQGSMIHVDNPRRRACRGKIPWFGFRLVIVWVNELKRHVFIHCEFCELKSFSPYWLELEFWLELCRFEWTHKIGNPLGLLSHLMFDYFLGSSEQVKGKDKIIWFPCLLDYFGWLFHCAYVYFEIIL